MGIRNRDGALFMATGIDNSGLYAGKREAMGVIKTLASEVTSFDIFGGIGISAATAFARAAKSSYDFEKEFRKNMLEVATISTQVTDDMTGFMNQVMSITQEIPIKAPEAAKALYSIVSAGHDGANGMKILEVSAKAAVGGLTETETAADAITTILNAYKMSAEEAGTVSDQLFTTVRLGKTTFGELGASIAQVAPIAAAYGISIDQVLGAVASLTKQGTPTAQAMTQIRAAIQGTAGELGDAAFQGRTFQEALQLISEKAGGSASKMKEMLGTDEGLAATLALTGKNAQAAANDFVELQNSVGATEAAFEKMKDEVDNQMTLLSNNIQAALRPMGEAILQEVSDIAKSFNEAFESGDLERSLMTLKSLLEVSAVAWGTYKVAVVGTATVHNLYVKSLALSRLATIQHTTVTNMLTKAFNAQTAAMLKNPYAIMAAAIAALGVAMYKLWTYQTNAQKQQEKLNKTFNEFTVEASKEERSLSSLFEALKRTNSGTDERKKMIKAVNDQYGQYLPKLLTEKSSLDEINEAYSIINTSIKEQIALKIKNSATDEVVTSGLKEQVSAVSAIRKSLIERVKNVGLVDSIVEEIKQTTDEFQKAGSTWEKAWQQAYFNVQRKYTGKIKLGNDFASMMEDYVKSVFNTEQAVTMIEKQYAPFISKIKNLNENVGESVLTAETKIVVSEDEKALKLHKKLTEQLLTLRRQNQQSEIDLMKEGSEKKIAQINLDYDNAIAAILTKEKEWKDAQGGKLTKEQTVEIRTAMINTGSKRDKLISDVNKERLEKEKQAMDEYLKEYGSFMEKKQAITDLYNEQISKATTPGEKLSLKKQLDEELKSLDLSEFKKGINFAEVFGNLDNLTTDSITRLRDKLKDYINKAASGLKPEDLKDLSDALANIEIKAAEKNPFGEIGKSLDDYKQATEGVEQAQDKLNYVMSGGEIVIGLYEDSTGKLCKKLLTQEQAENDLVKAQNKRAESIARLNTALAAGVGKAQEYSSVATAMVGTLEDFGVEVPEQLTGFIDGMGKTLDSLASIDLTKPVSAITGIIGAIGGIGKAIGSLFNNDSKKEKNIERLQEQVDVLDKSYEKLSQSIENAYSTDASNLIDQQNKMLEQQKVLIEQQIAEEESKKHTDDDRIKEWREQLDEINNTIEDNKVKAQDAIFGSDVKSAIDDFANAYVDAWGAGEDRAKSMKDTVKKMIKGVIVEMMKADLAPTVQALRDKIESALSDGIISDYEQSELDRLIEQATSNMDSKYSWADKYLNGDDPDSTSTREATAKGIASISQDSANAIDGKMSSQLIFLDKTLVEVTSIREQMSFIRELQIRGWEDVRAIRELSSKVSDNTNRIADLSEKIVDVSDKIEVNTSKAARTVQDIKDSGLILKKQ